MRRSRHLQGAVRVELGTDHTTETLGMGNEGDQPEHPGRSRRLALKACAVLGLSVPVGFGLLVLTEAPAFAASPTATVTCGATLSITADTASPTTVSVVGGNEKIDGFSVTNANYPGCSAAPYATITSSVATTFSTDGSLASLSFTGNSSGSSLSFSANHPLVLSPTSAGGGSATFNSNTLTYAGIDGTIAGGSGANTVAVPAPTSTNTTFVSPTTIGVGASSPGTTYTTVSGFTVFDASGVASTDSVAFTNDGSVAGVSFTGNGANSLLAFSGSHALDLLPTSAGGGTATFNSHTLTYSGIGGTITGGASTNTVTVPIPTSTNTTFVSATSIGVGATSPGTIYANLSSFTVFDASGVTNTKSVAFTTDGSVAGLSYTGNGADSALTFSGSHALNLSPTSAGAGTATFNSNSLTYAGIGGLITGGGSTNTATVPIPTSGKTFVLASSSGETIGVGASSPGTIYANLSSFTAFDASAVTSTKGVVFTTDGSIAGLSFTGNGTNSALAFSGSHALNLSPASAGGGTATFNSNSLTYAGIGGTITGGGSTNTVTVPDPGATDTTFVLATSSGETIGVGASSPGTVNANVSGFTVFDASGVTSADSVAFTTDGSIAGISFTGNGVNSALTFSGSHVLDLSPASAGGGTATFNSNALTYSGIGGTISGGGSTNTVTVPDPGAINTTFVSPAAVGVGTTSPGTAWATISGFTVFDASGVTSTDSVAFTNDGSVAGVSFTGNGANSSLAFSGNHP
ncbi:MAG: hypothetical protein JWO62_3787, partial [Acidimicrobiaceae bacterium]|nr:hypothetical protein [Acidimicrobiaceae bacterium]